MNRAFVLSAILCFGILLLTDCTHQECATETKTGIVNPNGDSELALLMRALFEDGMAVRAAVLDGQKPVFSYSPEEILTAHATEPEKAASPEYKAFSEVYIHAARALEAAGPEDRPVMYQSMIQACMTCHQALCPGPMRKIERLYLEEL